MKDGAPYTGKNLQIDGTAPYEILQNLDVLFGYKEKVSVMCENGF